MGVLDFFKKKPQSAASATELKIPPPQGPPGRNFNLESPITAPRYADDLEIPLPAKEFELPRLEFPSLPVEEEAKSMMPETRKPALAMPSLEDLEAEAPHELPDLEGEAARLGPAPKPLTFPSLPRPMPSPAAPTITPPTITPTSPKLALPAPTITPAKKPAKVETASFEELEMPVVVKHGEGPLFINLSGYKTVLLTVDDIRDHLKRANDRLADLNGIKSREDSALEAWHSSLENIQRKMIFIDRSLFEKQEG